MSSAVRSCCSFRPAVVAGGRVRCRRPWRASRVARRGRTTTACGGPVPARLQGQLARFRAGFARASVARSEMEFRILGPLEVEENGKPLAPGGRKARALLALLL